MINSDLQAASSTPDNDKLWPLVEHMLKVSKPVATISLLFGLIIFVGYLLSWELLYRPFDNGPATHPMTAICITLIASYFLIPGTRTIADYGRLLCVLTVILITAIRLLDSSSLSLFIQTLTPFQAQVSQDLQAGHSNSMGTNSAIMLLSTAISLTLFNFKFYSASQIIASVSLAVPSVSFTGYAYGLDGFYGQMSLITATTGFALATATIALTSNSAGLRAILSPYIGGIISRRQALAGLAFPLLIGYICVQIMEPDSGELFGLFVVSTCWFSLILVSISAIYQERIDLERRDLVAQLKKAAYVDPLTGLWNRRKLFQFGLIETERMERRQGQYWFLMIDIDRFKHVNDTAGHDLGDHVLVTLGKTIQHSIRKVDLLCRMGGEEFAVVLVDCNKDGAERVAESIRKNVEEMQVDGWTSDHGPITVSIGCAGNTGKMTFEKTSQLADNALYYAKNTGRNKVAFYEDIEN